MTVWLRGHFVELSDDLFQCDLRPSINSPGLSFLPVTLLALIREAGGSFGPEDGEACRAVEAAFSVSRRKHGWTSKQLWGFQPAGHLWPASNEIMGEHQVIGVLYTLQHSQVSYQALSRDLQIFNRFTNIVTLISMCVCVADYWMNELRDNLWTNTQCALPLSYSLRDIYLHPPIPWKQNFTV